VYNYFVWWRCDRVLDRIHHALYVECRDEAEREASPTAAIIDSQSVKSASKLIKGKKRHILVDTLGLLLHAIIHAADIQDRDSGLLLLAKLFGTFPFLQKPFADSAYQGPIFDALAEILPYLQTEIVKRPAEKGGPALIRTASMRLCRRVP
jgi:putative transposase